MLTQAQPVFHLFWIMKQQEPRIYGEEQRVNSKNSEGTAAVCGHNVYQGWNDPKPGKPCLQHTALAGGKQPDHRGNSSCCL
ncbi:hypothetical protein AMECASPLE_006670 [Ameca splendens]|uniref:Uncharacterized protein n=1 Tax=Ameca splendens TaxID=208324 RepID=A0ABV0YAP4_9TELE